MVGKTQMTLFTILNQYAKQMFQIFALGNFNLAFSFFPLLLDWKFHSKTIALYSGRMLPLSYLQELVFLLTGQKSSGKANI